MLGIQGLQRRVVLSSTLQGAVKAGSVGLSARRRRGLLPRSHPWKPGGELPPVQQLLPPALALVSLESVSGDHSMSLVSLAVWCGRKGQLHLTPVCRPNQSFHPAEGHLSIGGLLWPWTPGWHLGGFCPRNGRRRAAAVGGRIALLLILIGFALWGRSLFCCGSGLLWK